MQIEGKTDDAIIGEFVKSDGIKSLVVPPAEGFNLLAWAMPLVMIGIGLTSIWWFLRRYAKPSTAPELDPRVLERYRDTIEKNVSKLDG